MDYIRLLRFSHIFSAVVREVLEAHLLREVCPFPLNPTQFHLLKLMAQDGEHHVGEIAEVLGVSTPAATKNIDKLERHGLVSRAQAPDDRRSTVLTVSPLGRRIVVRFEELTAARLYPVLERFDEEDLTTFTDVLERFALSILELDPENSRACLRCAAYLSSDCSVGEARGGCPFIKDRDTVHGKGS
jgi:DNA-binding MarR family transcriptional regulator